MKRGHTSKMPPRLTKPQATVLSNGGAATITATGESPPLNRAPGSRLNNSVAQQPAGMAVTSTQQVNVSMNNSGFGESRSQLLFTFPFSLVFIKQEVTMFPYCT